MLEWVYTAAVRLAAFVQDAELYRDRDPGGPRQPWREISGLSSDELSAEFARAVTRWFYDRRGMR